MERLATVITGDLIASTQAGQDAVDGSMAVIEALASHEAQISGLDIRFARFRGDGWQLYCPEPARGFRLTVLVLANLHSRPDLPKTRLSVAVGGVSRLPATGLASASGNVFWSSGRRLDNMKTQKLDFYSEEKDAHWRYPLFSYLEWQSSRWSPEQAEAVALAFRCATPAKSHVAENLGISRQAALARLNGAGFGPLSDADAAFYLKYPGTP